jgi:hypothetical protein
MNEKGAYGMTPPDASAHRHVCDRWKSFSRFAEAFAGRTLPPLWTLWSRTPWSKIKFPQQSKFLGQRTVQETDANRELTYHIVAETSEEFWIGILAIVGLPLVVLYFWVL